MRLAFGFLATIFVVGNSFAAPFSGNVELNQSGKSQTISVPAGFEGSKISAYLVSKGNLTEYLSLSVTGPAGAVVTAKSAVMKTAAARSLTQIRTWVSNPFLDSQGKERASLKLKGYQGAVRSLPVTLRSTGNFCGDFSLELVDQTRAEILRELGVDYTREEICQIFAGSGVNPSQGSGGSNGGGTAYTPAPPGFTGGNTAYDAGGVLVRKDACGTKASDKYLVVFEINLKGVSAEERAKGFDIVVAAARIPYVGGKAATLKPTSDGKFAPRALFLLTSTGGWGGEHLNLVRWSRGKPSVKKVKVEDYVYYRGKSLTRSVAEPFLKGGKATIEVQSKSGIYGVCFSLVKTRQRYNGYTN